MIDRFTLKIGPPTPTGCWPWLAAIDRDGYGAFKVGRAKLKAHRVSWERRNGPMPIGSVLRHDCDNRWCVNPDHLRPGTVTENNRDMWRRGRGRGNPIGAPRKFPLSTEREIRALYSAGELRQKDIAQFYGTTQALISRVVRRGDRVEVKP